MKKDFHNTQKHLWIKLNLFQILSTPPQHKAWRNTFFFKQAVKETINTSLFTIASNKIKFFGIDLKKKAKEWYKGVKGRKGNECKWYIKISIRNTSLNFQRKRFKGTLENDKIWHTHGLAQLIFCGHSTKCNYRPNTFSSI